MTAASLPGAATIGKLFRQFMFPGVAGVAVAITLAFFEMLKSSPGLGADLLKAWGPGFILGLLAIAVVGSFLGQMLDAQQSGVEAQQQNAAAQKEVAVALTRVAEKDDRERDRMVTETQYMMQKMEQTHAIMARTEAAVNRIESALATRDAGDR
jgi:hypothetical protein